MYEIHREGNTITLTASEAFAIYCEMCDGNEREDIRVHLEDRGQTATEEEIEKIREKLNADREPEAEAYYNLIESAIYAVLK